MRIALRASGGRGEYEITGSQGNINHSALFEREIILELIPGIRMKTGNILKSVQGKPRLRLKGKTDSHIYLLVAAALLLPKPKREISKTPTGQIQITTDNFGITSIEFDIVELHQTEAIIRPTNLVLLNSSGNSARINVIERLRSLFIVWDLARTTTNQFSFILLRHKHAFTSANFKEIQEVSKQCAILTSNTDPLRHILLAYAINDLSSIDSGTYHSDTEITIHEVDEAAPEEARVERIREWRLQANRGQQGQQFRNKVTQAYNFTCLFSGYYLPKTVHTASAGVDAAHILPWAEYDLNSVSNGLCLNKLCHWAFDSGLLRLDFDTTKSLYILSIPESIRIAGSKGEIDLRPFQQLVGYIPVERLPHDRSLWPSPRFIEKFNEDTALV